MQIPRARLETFFLVVTPHLHTPVPIVYVLLKLPLRPELRCPKGCNADSASHIPSEGAITAVRVAARSVACALVIVRVATRRGWRSSSIILLDRLQLNFNRNLLLVHLLMARECPRAREP